MNRKGAAGVIDARRLEESTELLLDFEKLKNVADAGEPVLPVAVQDADTQAVLIIAYANEQAVRCTLRERIAVFWSTSRNELWVKGKTSGDVLRIVEVRVNCEQNSLLYLVRPAGSGSCHTKDAAGKTRGGCYYRKIAGDGLEFIPPVSK
ncbi:MAG: phosphoribosyl-AMP cyclohydrolase [Candidatus Omnitrophica bacterium]|nr:phosphoribosyl-AMP cyclohydrolase [Candidatus Omnitrophota bacterium]